MTAVVKLLLFISNKRVKWEKRLYCLVYLFSYYSLFEKWI